jgi:hypothetical protein
MHKSEEIINALLQFEIDTTPNISIINEKFKELSLKYKNNNEKVNLNHISFILFKTETTNKYKQRYPCFNRLG